MKNMRISAKLTAGFAVVTGLAWMIGIVCLLFINNISAADTPMYEEHAQSLAGRISVFIILAMLLIIAAAIGIVRYLSNRIGRPIQTMSEYFERFGMKGDLATSEADEKNIAENGGNNDEIGRCIHAATLMAQRLTDLGEKLSRVTGGDLTIDIQTLSEKDSIGIAIHEMVESLNTMFENIHASAVQVSAASKQIADGAQVLAQGSTEQASAIEELSSSISEVADKTKQNTGISREAADLSGAIKGNAEKGSRQMDQMMQAVREINDASNQIGKVIKVIDDIAFQTNILALNAAVEAARAGQHGKGFAVVAEEVRNLAAKSAEAARDTGGLIENSIAKANLGLAIATETAASLQEIVEGINRSAEIVMQIAQSSDEQASAITHINTGIDQVAQVVQQNSATAEESAAASEEMSGQSHMLSQLISQFKLKNAGVSPLRQSRQPITKIPHKQPAVPNEAPYPLEAVSGDFGKY